MDEIFQHIVNAMVLGSTYALLGIGLTIIFGIMRVVNFAHGELYTLGAYVAYGMVALLKLDFFSSILVAAAVGMLVGALIEFVFLRRKDLKNIDEVMLIMIGIMIVMQNLELLAWGGVAKIIPTPFSQEPISFGSISIAPTRLFVFGVAAILLFIFYLGIERTRFGLAIRATFQDQDAARIVGVNVKRIYTLTFALGSAMAAVAGALLAPMFVATPMMGDLASLKAFAIVILGGLGNLGGAALGGFLLAFIEEFGASYISSAYRDAFGFLVIIIVMLFRPQGLFSVKERVG
ncbi:branched-chain amino acid ABC transporter permease [Marinobacter nanhaiticus D15-8W]|uniref:Branched-chain amino acid ABC transporter permease n=1 Tax=Marinobacter nanhaiticus D15-8W TaxID=626887 RepID=N6VXS3_9GAMM|nr:branched-chain amino acid ABC transporter permease [Marinobacter nanhaiticus]ENO15080.1 branched-chain amino acid ABC transporter permease [Marinobacter nanhaiticus D15-8W]BES69222.1 branched-chain amino acid ABC transporter permease [Marinobacter nanhaiticus D15-8W]